MSNISLSSLDFITRDQLAHQIKSSQPQPQSSSATQPSEPQSSAGGLPPHIAVVDVRDSDHIGGHIRGSTWVPSSQLDHKTPELIRTLKDKEVVVFHCALSQQRGPSAALRYLREKERLDPTSWVESKGEVSEGAEKGEEEGNDGGNEGKKKQKVVVLQGGFTEWQEKYGSDEKLTEGWQKDIWEMGY